MCENVNKSAQNKPLIRSWFCEEARWGSFFNPNHQLHAHIHKKKRSRWEKTNQRGGFWGLQAWRSWWIQRVQFVFIFYFNATLHCWNVPKPSFYMWSLSIILKKWPWKWGLINHIYGSQHFNTTRLIFCTKLKDWLMDERWKSTSLGLTLIWHLRTCRCWCNRGRQL